MNRIEKGFLIFYWLYIAVYLTCFIALTSTGLIARIFSYVIPFHIFGMLQGIPMLIVVFRDLYKRDFPDANTKVTWAILMLMFCPSILVYLYKHGFRPRPVAISDSQTLETNTGKPPTVETGNPYQSPQG